MTFHATQIMNIGNFSLKLRVCQNKLCVVFKTSTSLARSSRNKNKLLRQAQHNSPFCKFGFLPLQNLHEFCNCFLKCNFGVFHHTMQRIANVLVFVYRTYILKNNSTSFIYHNSSRIILKFWLQLLISVCTFSVNGISFSILF